MRPYAKPTIAFLFPVTTSFKKTSFTVTNSTQCIESFMHPLALFNQSHLHFYKIFQYQTTMRYFHVRNSLNALFYAIFVGIFISLPHRNRLNNDSDSWVSSSPIFHSSSTEQQNCSLAASYKYIVNNIENKTITSMTVSVKIDHTVLFINNWGTRKYKQH